ncbi:MAG: DUF6596 domain-containing protein [Pseudomonadota bacterium]
MTGNDARAAAENAARHSYGKLLALICSSTRDISAAEDALSEAFAAALKHWPETGVPDAPEAWLLTAARRRLIDIARRTQTQEKTAEALGDILRTDNISETPDMTDIADDFPDRRLALLFACAHPAIDRAVQTPLMLQTVLGLDATRIAKAFAMPTAAMAQRLVRAKRKIISAGIPFTEPSREDMSPRLGAVLSAIYAGFSAGYGEAGDASGDAEGFADEAIFLGRLLVSLAPDAAEAKGLLALMLFVDARKDARRFGGRYIPIAEQNVDLWQNKKVETASKLLVSAASSQIVGRFQLEAAIQSATMAGRVRNFNPATEICGLYRALIECAPSLGAKIGYAAALCDAGDTKSAREQLESLDPKQIERHQPYWATLAHVEENAGEIKRATTALRNAIALTSDPAVVEFLRRKLNKFN